MRTFGSVAIICDNATRDHNSNCVKCIAQGTLDVTATAPQQHARNPAIAPMVLPPLTKNDCDAAAISK